MKRAIAVLCLILVSSITYYVGPFRFGDGEWSSRTVDLLGKIGGVCGTLVVVFIALTIGLALKGKARKLVTGGLYCFLALGIAYVLIGIVAVIDRQPLNTYCPILLAGILNALVPAIAIRVFRKWQENLELRRMNARDAR